MTPDLAARAAKLIRLLASDRDGEALGAARALQRALKAGGSDLNGLASAVEGLGNDSGADHAEHIVFRRAKIYLIVGGDRLTPIERGRLDWLTRHKAGEKELRWLDRIERKLMGKRA